MDGGRTEEVDLLICALRHGAPAVHMEAAIPVGPRQLVNVAAETKAGAISRKDGVGHGPAAAVRARGRCTTRPFVLQVPADKRASQMIARSPAAQSYVSTPVG